MTNFAKTAFSAIALIAAGSMAQATTFLVEDKIVAEDGAEYDAFGISIATSGTTAIIGAQGDDDSSGAAYLFDTTTGTQIVKLTADDGAASDYFGHSIAISGTTAIVGATGDDDSGDYSGSAYLFDTTTGTQIAKLTANDGAAYDTFGETVAISGTTAIVGATGDDDSGSYSGSAYLFDTTTGTQITKLTADDSAASDFFGVSVAISGTTAIVGAYADDDSGNNSGAAYLFDATTGTQIAKLTADDGAANDYFGSSVAISGTTAIVGAYADDDSGNNSGAAYLFDTITGTQIAKLTADDGAASDFFGVSVAIFGTTAIVGAYGDDDNGNSSGAAYMFDTITGTQIAKLIADDGAGADYFGYSVAASETMMMVGAYGDNFSGSAYLYSASIPAVPLPAGGVLLLTALFGMGWMRRSAARA
jgi:hypothetical protein